jgi:hypothetical protein
MQPTHAQPPPGTNLDLFDASIVRPTSTGACSEGVDAIGDTGVLEIETPSPAAAESQLDLFRHSPAEIAAHSARIALRENSIEQVRHYLAQLHSLPGYARFVADCEACLELIERHDPRWQDVATAVTWIEAELAPAAERCIPDHAAQLLRPAWLALLRSMPPTQDAARPRRAHSAYLWQLLGEPANAVAAIETDPRWREYPETLVWHTDLCKQAGLDVRAMANIVELCLAWPTQAKHWLASSPAWTVRWNAWCELDDALPMHAFPAWVRLRYTSEIPLPDAGDTRPGATLLRLADQLARDPTNLVLRKTLQQRSPALLRAFLAARGSRND